MQYRGGGVMAPSMGVPPNNLDGIINTHYALNYAPLTTLIHPTGSPHPPNNLAPPPNHLQIPRVFAFTN